jgi:hypothetical protein
MDQRQEGHGGGYQDAAGFAGPAAKGREGSALVKFQGAPVGTMGQHQKGHGGGHQGAAGVGRTAPKLGKESGGQGRSAGFANADDGSARNVEVSGQLGNRFARFQAFQNPAAVFVRGLGGAA